MPVTEALMHQWHRELNRDVFEYTLPDTTFVYGKSKTVRKFKALAEYIPDEHGKGTILIDSTQVTDERLAKACLLHEMIHQWQDLCGLRLDHRAVFNAWCSHSTSITGLVP